MTKDPGVPSLADFAHARGVHSKAPWMESLPDEILDEVIEAWKTGIRGTPIVEWLKAKGYSSATNARVTGYLSQRYPDG